MANNKFFIAKNGILTPVRGVFGSSTDNGTDALQVTGSTLLTGPTEITGLVNLTDITSNNITGGQQAVTITGGLDVSGWAHFDIAGQNVVLDSDSNTRTALDFRQNGNGRWNLQLQSDGDLDFVSQGPYTLRYNDDEILTSNSAIDADTLDGLDSTQFLRSDQDDTMFGSLIITGDLTVSGNTTTVNTEEVNIADNIILLNSNYTGSSPTENAGIEIERGTLSNSSLIWDEPNDWWKLISAGSDLGRIITTADEGSGNGFDADTVDGLEASQFLRSDVDDTAAGNITIEKILTVGNGSGFAQISMNGAGTDRVMAGTNGVIGFLNSGLVYVAYSDTNDNWIVPQGDIFGQGNLIAGGSVYANNVVWADNTVQSGGVVIAGTTVTAGTDVIGQRFIDADDNNYVIDPNSDSEMNQIRIDNYVRHRGDLGTYFGFPNNEQITFYTNNAERILIQNTRVDVKVDLYAPRLIDSDNNTYLVDPAGASQFNSADFDGTVTGVDVNLTGDLTANNATFAGDVDITGDATANNASFSGDVTGKRFIDVDSPTYIVDPNQNSTMHSIGIDDDLYHNGDIDTKLQFTTDNISLQTGGTEQLEINNTFVEARNQMRADSYYDANNLAYSAVLSQNSRFNNILLVGKIQNDSESDTYINFSASDTFSVYTASGERLKVATTFVEATNEFRAPLFRDSVSTDFYWDPATSNSHRFQTPSGYLDIGPKNTSYNHFQTDRPQHYFDKPVKFDGNISGYGGDETASFAQFIDSNDNTFLVDPNSTSRLNNINLVGIITHDGDADTNINFPSNDVFNLTVGGVNALTANTTVLSTDLNFEAVDGTFSGDVIANNLTAITAMYSPIYYDSDNINYYGDFASRSYFNTLSLNVAAGVTATDSTLDISGPLSMRTTSPLYFGVNSTTVNSWTGRIRNRTGTTLALDAQVFEFGNVGYTAGAIGMTFTSTGQSLDVYGSVTSPIYYDRDDINYYMNPKTSTRLNGWLSFGIPGNGTNTDGRWLSIEGNADGSGEGSSRIFFSEHNSTTGSMSAYGMSLAYRGGGTSIVGADGNTWTGLTQIGNGEWALFGHDANANGLWAMRGPRDASYVEARGSFRAPIFYDSGDITYYGNFSSTSRMNDISLVGEITHDGDADTFIQFPDLDQFNITVGGVNGLTANTTVLTTDLDIYAGNITLEGNSGDGTFAGNVTANNVTAATAMYSPIYYDADDNDYYLDPNNSTLSLTAGGSIRVTNIADGSRWLDTAGNGGIAINGYGWNGGTENPNIAISGANGGNALLYLNRRETPNFDPYTISNQWIDFRREGVQAGAISTGPDLNSGANDNIYMLLTNGTAGAAGGNNFQIWNADFSPLMMVQYDGNLIIGQYYTTYTASDNTPLVDTIANNRIHVETGSMQLNATDAAYVVGAGTSTFLKMDELGFGQGGGFYMDDANTVKIRNDKDLLTAGNIYAGTFYDDDNNDYYLDPAGNSQLNTIDIDDYVRHRGDLTTYIGFPNANTDTFEVVTNDVQRFQIDNNSADFRVNVYAPRYYDSVTPSYYLDPAQLSELHSANFYSGGTTNTVNIGRGASQRIRLYVTDSIGYLQYYQDETNATNHSFNFDIVSSSSGANRFNFNRPVNVSGTITSSTGMYAPAFYDSDDSTYYGDFAGTSIMNRIDINDYIRHNGDLNTYMGFGGNDQWRVTTNNAIRILTTDAKTEITPEVHSYKFVDIDNDAYFIEPASESRMNTIKLATTGVVLDKPTGSYGSLQITGGATGSYEGFSIGGRSVFMHDNSTVTGIYDDVNNKWFLYGESNSVLRLMYNGVEQARTENGYFLANNEIRSPIFRDTTNPTSWYVDPSSTSRIDKLEIVSAANDAFIQGGYNQNNPIESEWYQTGTYLYNASLSPATRWTWIKLFTMNTNGAKAIVEYYFKDDVNYSGNAAGRIVASSWNSSTVSVDHHSMGGPQNSVSVQVRIDSNRAVWIRGHSNTWDSYLRFHYIQANGITRETSWSNSGLNTVVGQTNTAGNLIDGSNGLPAQFNPPNSSPDILQGQQTRASQSNVPATSVTNTTNYVGNLHTQIGGTLRADTFYDISTTANYIDLSASYTQTAIDIQGRIYKDGFLTSSNYSGEENKFLVAQDYSHWIWNTATNWGIFWAGNTGAYRSYFSTSNPNEIVFIGNGNTRASIDLDNGNAYFQGDVIGSDFLLNGGNENISINPAYGSGGADLVLFDMTQYFESRVTKSISGSEDFLTSTTSEYVKNSDGPFAGSYVLRTSSYRTFDSDFIPVSPGEVIYGEVSARYISGTSNGLLYCGVRRYDKDKNPIAGNSGITYFVTSSNVVTHTNWVTYRGHTTIPPTHTPYNGSDGGACRFVRLILLVNYAVPAGGGGLREVGGVMLKRRNAESNLLVDDLVADDITADVIDANIFRDRDTSSYYLDPGATSTSLNVRGQIRIKRDDNDVEAGWIDWQNASNGNGRIRAWAWAGDPVIEFSDASNGASADQVWAWGADDRSRGSMVLRFNGSSIFGPNWTSQGVELFQYKADAGGPGVHNLSLQAGEPNLYRLHVGGTAYATTSMRAPYFFDVDDTDPQNGQPFPTYRVAPAFISYFNDTRTNILRASNYINVGGFTSSGVNSYYTWDGATYRNPGTYTTRLLVRQDNTTTSINGSIPALALYNNAGGDQTTVRLDFASREQSGAGNPVALAGIIAKKEASGQANAWTRGSLNFYVKDYYLRRDVWKFNTTGDSYSDYPMRINNQVHANTMRANTFYDDSFYPYWYANPAGTSRLRNIEILHPDQSNISLSGWSDFVSTSASDQPRLFVGDYYNNTQSELQEGRRPTINLRGQYPQLKIVSSYVNNSTHGGTLQFLAYDGAFASSGNYKQWVLGTSGTNATRFSIGYSTQQFAGSGGNPHYGIGRDWAGNAANYVAIMWLENNRNVYMENDVQAGRFVDRNDTNYWTEPGDETYLRYLGFHSRRSWASTNNDQIGYQNLSKFIVNKGRKIYPDEDFQFGYNSTGVYNNAGNGTVYRGRFSSSSIPNESKRYIRYYWTGGYSTPGRGGFYFNTPTAYNRVIVCRFTARLAAGAQFNWASNSIGASGTFVWLTDQRGTGKWEDYACMVVSGTSSWSTTMFFYVTGVNSAGVLFDLASATCFWSNDEATHSSLRYVATDGATQGIVTNSLAYMQADRFYDTNANYYLDPDDTTNIRYLKSNTRGTSSYTRALTIKSDGTSEINFGSYPAAWTSALQIQNNNNTDFIWISPLQDGYNARFRTAGSGLDFYTDGANNTGTRSAFIGSGYIQGITKVVAPYFEDTDSTYFVDPSSGSNIVNLTVNGTNEFNITNQNGRLYFDNYLVSTNQGGMMGDYNLTGTRGKVIWTIGESWPWGNMYGLAYEYNSTWGHHLSLKNNGTTYHRISFSSQGVDGSGSWRASGDMRAPIFYDRNNTTYFLDPWPYNSSYIGGVQPGLTNLSNINGFGLRTRAMIGLPGTDRSRYYYGGRYDIRFHDRPTITGNTNYWTGAMGWGRQDFNTTVANWGSGFIDTWSNPPNQPYGTSHWVGMQSWHYNDGNNRYGYQLVGGPILGLWMRSAWGPYRSWYKIAMYNQLEFVAPPQTKPNMFLYATSIIDPYDTGYFVRPAGTYNGQDSSLAIYVNGEICNSNYAAGNLQPGALNIGRTDRNYRWEGSSWAASVNVGILANCADYWEFAIHDSGESVESVFYYNTSNNYLQMGRNLGWGTMQVYFHDTIRVGTITTRTDTGYSINLDGTSRIYKLEPNIVQCVNNRSITPRWDFSAYVVEAQHWYGNYNGQSMYMGESANQIFVRGNIRTNLMYEYARTDRWKIQFDSRSYLGRLSIGDYAGIASAAGAQGFEITNSGGTNNNNCALATFHCRGYYAVHLGLRHDSVFGVGGWSASSWRWYVQCNNGNMTATGNVTAYSDPRLKTDIIKIDDAITKIKKLNGMEFTWRDDLEETVVGSPGSRDYGVLSTEVEKVAPLAVHDSAHDAPEGDKYKTVAYEKLIPLLIEGFKEQNEIVEEQKKLINSQQEQINELKNLIQSLIEKNG